MPGDQAMRTPRYVFEALQHYIGESFVIDLFASADNALCRRYYTEAQDACAQSWPTDGVCFANPPFRDMCRVMRKAHREAARGVNTVIIGPVGCSQTWFHEVAQCYRVLVPRSRISFDASDGSGPTRGANRDTMIYLVGPRWENHTTGFDVMPISLKR